MTDKQLIDKILHDQTYEGGVQWWINKHDQRLFAHVELTRENAWLREKLTAPATIDAITNMIDHNIRKGKCGTYDEWQAEVERVLSALANANDERRR